MDMAASLQCTEEMMDESPDVSSEMKEMSRYKQQVPPEVISNHRNLSAFSDANILRDCRVFPGMLKMEKACVGYVNNYFKTVQTDITLDMKREVTMWMFEVCEEERMHDAVFIRSVQYMDKFLSIQDIARGHLQLLGAVCLLVSSKIAGTTISSQRLVSYTADSVTAEMILEWESLLLAVLKWEVYGVVSTDFVQHILRLLPRELWDNIEVSEKIKTFTCYCAVDHQFGVYLPSIIASASVAAAMPSNLSHETINQVLLKIQSATNVDLKQLKACIEQITTNVKMTVNEALNRPCTNLEPESKQMQPATVTRPAPGGCGIAARQHAAIVT